MKGSDLSYMCMLDNSEILNDVERTHRRLDILASHDNFKGAIWELDPNIYESGKG